MICWAKQPQLLISKGSSLYRGEKKMPPIKQPNYITRPATRGCYANRFTKIEPLVKSPECPPASELTTLVEAMLKKREEQDKKLFGPK
jgi:hypothetical protein